MLKSLFVWLDNHSGSYWLGAGLVTLLLAARVWTALRENAPTGSACSARRLAGDALVLFLFVLGWRWPFLFAANDFNPDESQLIAGAITLTRDPVFWRSVDGTTSGPLNFYALLPLHWLGLPLDYFGARLSALLMVAVALFACHRALTRGFGRGLAWVGVLPAAAFFATAVHPDLVHYSSEHVTLMLIAIAIWLLAERKPEERLRLWLACGLAGLAPWAKLQAAPLSAALVGWALWQEARIPGAVGERARRLATVLFAALAASLVGVLLIAVTGQASTALHRYFLNNLYYVNAARPLEVAVRELTRFAVLDGRLPILLGTTFTAVAGAIVLFAGGRGRTPGLFSVGAVLTLAGLAAVIAPRREYLHYVLLLPVPLTLWFGAALGGSVGLLSAPRARMIVTALAALLAVGVPVVTRCQMPVPEMYGRFARHWRYPRTAASVIIAKISTPSDTLAVWGWASHLYVETGRAQATRDAHTVWSINKNAQLDYHRGYYLADLQRNRPAVFVDAVGPEAFGFTDRETEGHEVFPALATFVRENYTLVVDLSNVRIYARRDLPGVARVTSDRLDEWIAEGRTRDQVASFPPSLTPLDAWPRRYIGEQEVLMLMPPAKLEWRLAGDEREVDLEFGFDPGAYGPDKGNGAEIILELVEAGQARMVFRRLLNPSAIATDRGKQKVTVPLPPFGPDTRLSLRSTPGENNDNAWDWLYVASVKFHHDPHFLPSQFPQFSRVPDFADARTSGLFVYGGISTLSLPAPSMVGYVLTGAERHLRFDYGMADGAYTNDGHTDGAVFRVARERAGQPAVVLFEQFLQPQLHADHRGRQRADIDLAGSVRGDHLVLRIDPGPANNGAWDWTYLDHVTLTGP